MDRTNGQEWSTVDAIAATGGGVEVYAGCGEYCDADGDNVYMRSTSGGWTSFVNADVNYDLLVASSNVHTQWWFASKGPNLMIDKPNYNSAQLLITTDPDSNNLRYVYSAGRSGIWRRQGGANWRPAVQGLAGTVARDVAVSASGANVGVADTDWAEQYSENGLSSTPQPTSTIGLPNGIGKSGYVVAFGNGRMYVALGDKTTPDPSPPPGAVFSCSLNDNDVNSCLHGPFADEHLPSSIASNAGADANAARSGNRVLGLAIGRSSPTAEWQLVAAVENVGIVRKNLADSAGWDVVSGAVGNHGRTQNNRVDINWQDGSNRVYVYDPAKGALYRSGPVDGVDGTAPPRQWGFGASPTAVWTPDDSSGDVADTNYMAGQRGKPDALYITTATKAYKVTNLEAALPAGGRLPSTPLTVPDQFFSPGPVAVDDSGEALVAEAAGTFSIVLAGSTPLVDVAHLFAASTPGGTQLSDIADAGYRSQALFPNAIAVSGSGNGRTVWVSDRGAGVTVMSP